MALSSEVTDAPVAVRVVGDDWVLVRLGGHLAAFPDQCPHRLAPLSAGHVDGGVLRCGYHGWCFQADGACVEIPATGTTSVFPPRSRLNGPAGLVERDGFIFLALEAPVSQIPETPEAFAPGFRHAYLGPTRASVGAGLMADNFLDLSHFPFVHAGTIGTDQQVRFDVDIERDGLRMIVRSEHLFPNREDPAVAAGTRPLLQHRRLTYTYQAPFSVCLRVDYVEAEGTNILSFHVQPEDDRSCRLFMLIARNDMDDDELLAAAGFEQKILEEDLMIQERYREKALPLDMADEVHIKADRMTVELRRILADFVSQAAVRSADDGQNL